MKQIFKRIISFLLSIYIVAVSVMLCPISVYAITPDDPSVLGPLTWAEMSDGFKWLTIYNFAVSQVKAVVNGNFADYLDNMDAMKAFKENHNVDDFASETGLTIPADLVALIKQALIEYANETNGFKIEQTYPVNAIPASTFNTKPAYEAFKSYCASHYYTVALPQCSVGYMYLADATPYIKDGGGFVNSSSRIVVLNSEWKTQSLHYDYYQLKTDSDGNPYINIIEDHGNITWIAHYDPNKKDFGVFRQDPFLITKDGGRIRVFNSVSAFMNYDAGQRKVYFGSGFYDFDPSDITATWDEINDKIGRMDDLLQDIIDIITDNPNISEEELEELIDQLIGKIGEIGDKTDETNTILGGISSTLSGIASSLSGYFNSALSYLGQILEAIKALVWIEADNKVDDDKSDLLDLIDKIWKDPETGSQEAADTLSGSFAEIASGITKKFPFSIPWDIYNLFRVFSGAPAPDEATFRTMTLGVEPFAVDNEDLEQDIHEAPYFKLPLRLDSYGIYEEVVIDLADFKTVSTLSRGLLSVLFAVFLIKFTIRIIELFKGGSSE